MPICSSKLSRAPKELEVHLNSLLLRLFLQQFHNLRTSSHMVSYSSHDKAILCVNPKSHQTVASIRDSHRTCKKPIGCFLHIRYQHFIILCWGAYLCHYSLLGNVQIRFLATSVLFCFVSIVSFSFDLVCNQCAHF